MEQTKQKLLETLIELDNEFPNLINDYKMTQENTNKIQNVITNNIYGNNNSTNLATGENIEQHNVSNISIDFKKLEELGVSKSDIEQLQIIIQNSQSDKSSLGKTIAVWMQSVSASLIASGLYENIPKVIEFVQQSIL